MTEDAVQLVRNINNYLINPIIALLFLAAVVYFIWGLIVFIRDSKSADGRTKGGDHIMYGLIGMFIMVSVFTLIRIGLSTLGVTDSQVDLNPAPGDTQWVDINLNF
jgi:hypothetical protein